MKKLFIFLFFITAFLGCEDNILPTATDKPDTTPAFSLSEKDVVQGRMRIKLKEEPVGAVTVRNSESGEVITGIRILDKFATDLRITRMERTFPPAGKFEERSRSEGLHLWYDIWFSEEVAATRAINEVAVIEGIEIATPVLKVVTYGTSQLSPLLTGQTDYFTRNGMFLFNDPDFQKQWSFYNPGDEEWQEEGADIGIVDVWRQYNGHPDIIVAIVDGGIELSHPDLWANLWINPNEIAGNGRDDDDNGYIDDVYGFNFVDMDGTIRPHRHGTHVAGTIGAVNNNAIGVCGIAGGNGTPDSGVKLMSCQIFDHLYVGSSSDRISDNIAAAIKYGADNGAVISQNSWGYSAESGNRGYSYLDPAHKEAIDYFIKYAGCDNDGNQLPDSPMKGGIVLFAAGNNNSESARIAAPADYVRVLGIAAMGPDYIKAPYSNYGEYIDICGPGGLSSGEKRIYSTTVATSNYYEYNYGTSMACPHVAGVAALVIEKHGVGQQGFTAEQLEEILLSTAYDLDIHNPYYAGKLGVGGVDVKAALEADLPDNLPFVWETNTITNGKLEFRVNSEMAGTATVTIRNSTGNKVFDKIMHIRGYRITSIDVSSLSAGYYTLKYEFKGKVIKEKFIKY